MKHPSSHRGPRAVTRRSATFVGRRHFGSVSAIVAGALLVACSLTGDDLTPQPVGSSLRSSQSDSTDAGPREAVPVDDTCRPEDGCCDEDDDCAAGQACTRGRCEPRSCEGEGDLSACPIALCPGPNCPVAQPDGGAPEPLRPTPEATCDDGARNGDEADEDCGRACPDRCDDGSSCGDPLDCASLRCDGTTCLAATCADGIQNQDETDADCGGDVCAARCQPSQRCGADADCDVGLFCPAATQLCTDVSCQDEVLNGDEIETDCGGGTCPGCAVGAPCNSGTDCESRVCGGNATCAAATCNDGALNQDETATDCGGGCQQTCAVAEACDVASDCSTGVCGASGCDAGIDSCCQPARCDDGVRNGLEPVVDCGSLASCGLCEVGEACDADQQCETNVCDGTCQPLPPCEDGALSPGETDVDCGGGATGCPRCAEDDGCLVDGDCSTGTCSAQGTCIVVSCSDNVQNGTETGVDCGGDDPTCPRCPDGSACNEATDCVSQSCGGGICISCGDGVQNGTETSVDCGGADPACIRCIAGRTCSQDGDCESGACEGGRCCGGSQGDCTRCALRLSPTIDCDTTPPPGSGVPAVDATGSSFCNQFLQCLAQNPATCSTRNAPGCSGDNQATDACPHNDYGGNGGTGVTRANHVLLDAGCQL